MTYSLTLRENLNRRLTIQEMDDNFLYLQDLAQSGGSGNTNLPLNQVAIGGGETGLTSSVNFCYDASSSNFILGSGNTFLTNSHDSGILGGFSNGISHSSYSTIIGGWKGYLNNSNYSSVIGGEYGVINNSSGSILLGGNLIDYREPNHGIKGGNIICNGANNIISGGDYCFYGPYLYNYPNFICDSRSSAIIGGSDNHINCSKSSLILSGNCNYINYYNSPSDIVTNGSIQNSSNSRLYSGSKFSIQNSISTHISGQFSNSIENTISSYINNSNRSNIKNSTSTHIVNSGQVTIENTDGGYISSSNKSKIQNSSSGCIFSSIYSSILSGNSLYGDAIINSKNSIMTGGSYNYVSYEVYNNYPNTMFCVNNSAILGGYDNHLSCSNNSVILGAHGLSFSHYDNTLITGNELINWSQNYIDSTTNLIVKASLDDATFTKLGTILTDIPLIFSTSIINTNLWGFDFYTAGEFELGNIIQDSNSGATSAIVNMILYHPLVYPYTYRYIITDQTSNPGFSDVGVINNLSIEGKVGHFNNKEGNYDLVQVNYNNIQGVTYSYTTPTGYTTSNFNIGYYNLQYQAGITLDFGTHSGHTLGDTWIYSVMPNVAKPFSVRDNNATEIFWITGDGSINSKNSSIQSSYNSTIIGNNGGSICKSYNSLILGGNCRGIHIGSAYGTSESNIIIGGQNNIVSGGLNFNQNSRCYNYSNKITSKNETHDLNSSTILGGYSNLIGNSTYTIPSTYNHYVDDIRDYGHSTILGGSRNMISHHIQGNSQYTLSRGRRGSFYKLNYYMAPTVAPSSRSSIIGGLSNQIYNSSLASIIGGRNNMINSYYNTNYYGYNNLYGGNSITGGSFNTIYNFSVCAYNNNSAIIGGKYNILYNTTNSVLIGGYRNNLTGAENSAIIGGNNLILNGYSNVVLMPSVMTKIKGNVSFNSWGLGGIQSGTVAFDNKQYVEIEINGTPVKLAIVT